MDSRTGVVDPEAKEPYELRWHHIAKVLKEESWAGRWSPLDESNVGPLAGMTAAALIEGFRRLGLRLVAVEAGTDDSRPEEADRG